MYYTLFRVNGDVELLNEPFCDMKFSSKVLKHITDFMGWDNVDWSYRQFFRKSCGYSGGMVMMIWNAEPVGYVNDFITEQLEHGYEHAVRKGYNMRRNWGDGIRGDVIVKSHKPVV